MRRGQSSACLGGVEERVDFTSCFHLCHLHACPWRCDQNHKAVSLCHCQMRVCFKRM